MIAIIWQVALLLVLAFLIGLLLILDRKPRNRTRYDASPRSRSTPLGIYHPRVVCYDVPLEDGMRRAQERSSYLPGDESADTVKVMKTERGV